MKAQCNPNFLFAFMLAVLVSGCGGVLDDNATGTALNRVVNLTARTGGIVAVRVGETATLDGTKSTNPSATEALSYSWSFSSKPDASVAQLQNATTANPGFVADARGTYMVQLVVSAGGRSSQRAIQLVVATIAPEPLTGPFNHQDLSSNCVNCHNAEFITIPEKPTNHLGTSNMCQTCHTPLGMAIIPGVDHLEVVGNCSECHNGVLAIGKSEFHLPTVVECDSCHNTTSFLDLALDGSFDHTGISSGCSVCHNGTVSIGKTPNPNDTPPGTHPETNSECINCHTTDSFLGAYPDHTGPLIVGNSCDSCHNSDPGRPYPGRPQIAGHPLTNVDCNICHSIVTFSLGGIFNHRVDPQLQRCDSCHNASTAINAPAMPVPLSGVHQATTEDCGSCHDTEDFANAFVDHSLPPVVGNTCDFCHGVSAIGKPVGTHLPTIEDCNVCHTPGTFTTGVFDHRTSYIDPPALCTNCHNDVISVGKLFNHFPTPLGPSQDCADCHSTSGVVDPDFAGATFDHVGINSNDCTSCHNGDFSTTSNTLYGKPATHLPTSQDCSFCHSSAAPFKPASNFGHVEISAQCETCHDGNPDYVAVGAIGKKLNHIPALGECIVCHVNTNSGGFASPATFLADVHGLITSGCEGCHISRIFPDPLPPLVKGANHLPTQQDCYLCHTTVIDGFGPTNSIFDHVGISGNCASCHNGTYATGKDDTPNPPHPITAADCGLCHNTVSFADAVFDHTGRVNNCEECHGDNGTGAVTKKHVGHVPTVQDCSVCHVPGSFAPAVFDHTGIVDNCVSCHEAGFAKPKSGNHITTTEDCSVCHNTTVFAGARFDHQLVGINDTCTSCHNGTTARGKTPPPDHVPTNGDCRDCHQTTGFLPATFDHVGIVDNCASCHDAGFATPKKVGHVLTIQDCGVCHTPSAFKPATFDHTGITNNCASCHDGGTAKGMIDAVPAHIETSLDCSSCHTTATFVGGTWTHDSTSINNCDTCHDGNRATGKIDAVPTHLSTTEQCDLCHTTNGWAPTIFSHSPQGNYPGDHRRDPGCNGCHGNTISSTIPWPSSQYAPFCAACHASDFKRKDKHIGGENGTVAQNKDCSGSGCHKVGDNEF